MCFIVAAEKMQLFMWISVLALGAVSVALVSIYLFIIYCALSLLRLRWRNGHDSQTPFQVCADCIKAADRAALTLHYDI